MQSQQFRCLARATTRARRQKARCHKKKEVSTLGTLANQIGVCVDLPISQPAPRDGQPQSRGGGGGGSARFRGPVGRGDGDERNRVAGVHPGRARRQGFSPTFARSSRPDAPGMAHASATGSVGHPRDRARGAQARERQLGTARYGFESSFFFSFLFFSRRDQRTPHRGGAAGGASVLFDARATGLVLSAKGRTHRERRRRSPDGGTASALADPRTFKVARQWTRKSSIRRGSPFTAADERHGRTRSGGRHDSRRSPGRQAGHRSRYGRHGRPSTHGGRPARKLGELRFGDSNSIMRLDQRASSRNTQNGRAEHVFGESTLGSGSRSLQRSSRPASFTARAIVDIGIS